MLEKKQTVKLEININDRGYSESCFVETKADFFEDGRSIASKINREVVSISQILERLRDVKDVPPSSDSFRVL